MQYKDMDAATICKELPTEESAHGPNYHPGSGYFNVPAANAWVCIDSAGRLEIWPVEGGWLGVHVSQVDGDIAPFHG